eukprot:GHVR01111386.1.p1 GENE.GHVR01111386.1~~GHVR01111386.1.p1  ORF type:complete len:583 (-),score=126.83 GHVR01111386.1:295-2016(-)
MFVMTVNVNPSGWGPIDDDGHRISCLSSLELLPFETIVKAVSSDFKLGKACDFSLQTQKFKEQQDRRFGRHDMKEDDQEEFHLVDSKSFPKPRKAYPPRRVWTTGPQQGQQGGGHPQGGGQQGHPQGGGQWQGHGGGGPNQPNQWVTQPKHKTTHKNTQIQRAYHPNRYDTRIKTLREWSIQPLTDWKLEQEVSLAQFPKFYCKKDLIEIIDLHWAGTLSTFDKSYDRIMPRKEIPLKRFSDLQFHQVPATGDPVIQALAEASALAPPSAGIVTVYATDVVLAALITAGRSTYSWDIIVNRVENNLFLDKREGSTLQFLTVNETAQEPPSPEDKNSNNTPFNLSHEASCINQNLSQMLLDYSTKPVKLKMPHPFKGDEGKPAATAFRYRRVLLKPGPQYKTQLELVIRADVDCRLPPSSGHEDHYALTRALNEYDPKPGSDWRKSLESQVGAVLTKEISNNACKLARWVVQAHLAGCDTLKLAMVSRQDPRDNHRHSLLAVQNLRTDNFAAEIGLTVENMWGVVRFLMDILIPLPEGKYVLVKDPSKHSLRVYSGCEDVEVSEGGRAHEGEDT